MERRFIFRLVNNLTSYSLYEYKMCGAPALVTVVLQCYQLKVSPSLFHQLLVVTKLNNLPMVEDKNTVCVGDRAETMGNGNRRAATACGLQCALHELLGLRIKRRGCLIQ